MPIQTARAVDLLERYPTHLTVGDTEPEHARAWEFKPEDIFRVSQFALKFGKASRIETGPADLGIGHGADGAVWAVLIPRDHGTLTTPLTTNAEDLSAVWFRFHPAVIDQLFPAANIFADGNANLADDIRAVANAKMTSSWQSGGRALIPGTNEMTIFADTKSGMKRFFIVDTKAGTAEYVEGFNKSHDSAPMSWESAPPVVTKTVPAAGTKNVSPGTREIRVTFSKEMQDNSWSWSTAWKDSTPEMIGMPKYDSDHKTCMIKVKLEPGKTYGWWLNSQNFHGFKDAQGHPSVPYLLAFKTADK